MRRVAICAVLAVGFFCVRGFAIQGNAADYFRWNGNQLEFFEDYSDKWFPAHFDGEGHVVFQSGPDLWNTGFSPEDVIDAIGNQPGGSYYSNGYAGPLDTQRHARANMGAVNETFTTIKIVPGGRADKIRKTIYNPLSSGRVDDMQPAEIPRWQSGFSLRGRYVEDDVAIGSGAGRIALDSREFSTDLDWLLIGDRLSVVSTLTHTFGEDDPAGGGPDTDYERLSLRITPVYRLFMQETEGVDIDLIASVAAAQYWYDDPFPTDDPSTVFGAAGVGAGRTFSFADIRLSYIYGVTANIDGDVLLSGKSNVNMHQTSVDLTVPLGDSLLVGAGLRWLYTEDMPAAIDEDETYGSASILYTNGPWGVRAAGYHSLEDSNGDEWSLGAEVMRFW